MTQAEAVQLLGIDQPKASALMRGRLTGFSLERLLKYLNVLNNDIEVVVKPKAEKKARITVSC